MPNLECVNKEIAGLKKGQTLHTNQLQKLSYEVSENTVLTKETKADTAEIVELMRWLNTSKKIALWVGGLIGSIFAILEGLRHLK